MKLFRTIAVAVALACACASPGNAVSTVNPTVPAANSPLSSAVVRNNFAATYNDINNILGKFAASVAPTNQTALQDWADTSGGSVYKFKLWNPTTGTWVQWGSLNTSTGVFAVNPTSGAFAASAPVTLNISGGVATYGLSFDANFATASGQLALAPASAGFLIANCTGAPVEPTSCSWTSFADRAIGSTNGMIPSRVGGSWGTVSTGISGHTVPFLDGSGNVWTNAQRVYPGSSGLPSALTGSLLRLTNIDGVQSRIQVESFGSVPIISAVTYAGTAAVPLAVTSGTQIISLDAFVYNGSSLVGSAAIYRAYAAETFSSGHQGTIACIGTTPIASTVLADGLCQQASGGVTIGVPTGGDKGIGSLNAQSIFVNGVSVAAGTISALTGDGTATGPGSVPLTLATVNSNVGSFGNSTQSVSLTVNGKGLVTAASTVTITPAVGNITGLGTGVATALGINVGLFGSFVTMNGVLGTPSSGTATNLTGLPTTGLVGTLQAAQEPAHTGDVTNTAGSLALTIGAGIVTNAKLAASMPAYTWKCNNTGSGSQTPTDCDTTAFTSKASPVAGDIVLIQDSAASNAYKKTTVGALASAGSVGSLNLQTGALVLWPYPQGRLTLISGVSVMATSVAGATTVYYTGDSGKNVPIYNGTAVAAYQICAANTAGACEQSIVLGSNWVTNLNYDFFEGLNGGTPTLCTGPAWTSGAVGGSDVVRGTGAGSTELEQFDGLNTNKNSMTCRFNNTSGAFTCPAHQCTYLGSMRVGATGQTNFIFGASSAGGTAGLFGIWNAYNRVTIRTTVSDSNTNWNYATATIRSADGSTANRVSFISGLTTDGFSCQYTNRIQIAASALFTIGCALDSTTAFDKKNLALNGAGATTHFPIAVKNDYNPTLGWHFVQALEAGDGTNNNPSAGGPDESFIFEFQM
jgi:hypothetical protein